MGGSIAHRRKAEKGVLGAVPKVTSFSNARKGENLRVREDGT